MNVVQFSCRDLTALKGGMDLEGLRLLESVTRLYESGPLYKLNIWAKAIINYYEAVEELYEETSP